MAYRKEEMLPDISIEKGKTTGMTYKRGTFEKNDQSLKDIEREECPEDETCLVCDQRIYRRAHSDDRLCGEVQNRTVQRQSDEVVERYCDDAEHKCREKH